MRLTPERESEIRKYEEGVDTSVTELLAELDRVRADAKDEREFHHKFTFIQANEYLKLRHESDQLKAENANMRLDLEWPVVKERNLLLSQLEELEEHRHIYNKNRKDLLTSNDHLREKLEVAVEALDFSYMAIGHAIELGYVGEGSTLGMFKDAFSKADKALVKIRGDKPLDEWTETLRGEGE